MKVELVPFDPQVATRSEWERFHRYRHLRHEETDPDDPIESDASVEASMRRPHPMWVPTWHGAIAGGDQVGELYFETTRPGTPTYEANRHIAWLFPSVLRPHRRHGLARDLLRRGAELAREQGCTLLTSFAEEDDGKAFVDALGAKVVSNRRENRLQLDRVDWAMVDRWAREGPERNPTTNLRWFVNRVDDDVLEPYCEIFTAVFNQQPFDDVEHGDFVFTPEVFRDREGRLAATGRTCTTLITQEPSGEISSLTETYYDPSRATMMDQGLTGVKDVHRGRGLGKWIKAEMLQRVRREFPEVTVVATGNASSNEAMLAINERLGFRTHKDAILAQMPLEALERWLAASPPA